MIRSLGIPGVHLITWADASGRIYCHPRMRGPAALIYSSSTEKAVRFTMYTETLLLRERKGETEAAFVMFMKLLLVFLKWLTKDKQPLCIQNEEFPTRNSYQYTWRRRNSSREFWGFPRIFTK